MSDCRMVKEMIEQQKKQNYHGRGSKVGYWRKDETAEEELRKKGRQICREEEEEEIEVNAYHLRLEYMYDHCSECDRDICGLLKEQRELLDSLRVRKKEFADDISRRYLSWHM